MFRRPSSSPLFVPFLFLLLVVAATFCTKDVKPEVKATKSPGPKKNAEPKPAPEATYAEVLALPKHPETLLVDVREPQELLDTGVIPTSINVPRMYKTK